MSDRDRYLAAADKMAAYIDKLSAVANPTKAQIDALITDLRTEVKNLRLALGVAEGKTWVVPGESVLDSGVDIEIAPPHPWRGVTWETGRKVLDYYGYANSPSIDPDELLARVSPRDNQILSAVGVLGNPLSPTKGADYSLFEGVVGSSGDESSVNEMYYAAFRDGKEIARERGDGTFDTVDFWNRVA